MARDALTIGDRSFNSDDTTLVTEDIYLSASLTGEMLKFDTLTAVVRSLDTETLPLADNSGLALLDSDGRLLLARPRFDTVMQIPYGTPALYYRNGVLREKMYRYSVERIARTRYEIVCVSGMGILDDVQHYGGIYSGATVEAVLADIIGDTIPYTVDDALRNQRVYGWLPVKSKRENLHTLLFAMGAAVRKDGSGDAFITYLSQDVMGEVPTGRLSSTGGKVKPQDRVSAVSVTEHTFSILSTDEETTLYSGSVADNPVTSPLGAVFSGTLVTFSDPVHGLVIEGSEILESGVNYAVIAPSSSCTLTGKKYTHTTVVTTKTAEASGTANVLEVSDNTLISLANSENVAKRLLAYYSTDLVTIDAAVDFEKPGDRVVFTDPYLEQRTGYIESQDISVSQIMKAETVFVAGYEPTGGGNYYEHSELITEPGIWTVPEGVEKIRVVMIGGGAGGENGEDGGLSVQTNVASGTVPWSYGGLAATKGGAGGEAGASGKVTELVLEVTPGQTFTVAIGAGGDVGEPGGETSFGTRSSADGDQPSSGYIDIMTGNIYALPGEAGVDGGDGGDGAAGGSVGEWSGGAPGSSSSGRLSSTDDTYGSNTWTCDYSCSTPGGSGAAYGKAGVSGIKPKPSLGHGLITSMGSVVTKGASAVDRDPPETYGSGGHGGHGGGGNGSLNSISFTNPGSLTIDVGGFYVWIDGGKAGKASAGKQGCVIVYF